MLHVKSTMTALAAAAIFAAGSSANAATTINYGDFSDIPPGSVMYLDVTESSGTDAVPLYHAPGITGNALDFDPKGFIAAGAGGGSDLTDGQLNFTLMTLPGSALKTLTLSEGGDYSLTGTGTAATQASAAASIHITVLEVDGFTLPNPVSGYASASITLNLPNNQAGLAPWSLSLVYDIPAFLVSENIVSVLGATKAEVTIDNLLIAISEPQSTSLIAKKNFTLSTQTMGDPIPEPASLTLLGLGAACMLRRR